jgi:hypothetical protein
VFPIERRFLTDFGREPSVKTSIYKWYKLLDEAGTFVKGKRRGERPVIEGEGISSGFLSQPKKINNTSCPTIKHATVNGVYNSVNSFFRFEVYKYQLFVHVTTQYKEVRYTFCCDVLLKIEYDSQSWRNNPHAMTEGIRNSPKFNFFVP